MEEGGIGLHVAFRPGRNVGGNLEFLTSTHLRRRLLGIEKRVVLDSVHAAAAVFRLLYCHGSPSMNSLLAAGGKEEGTKSVEALLVKGRTAAQWSSISFLSFGDLGIIIGPLDFPFALLCCKSVAAFEPSSVITSSAEGRLRGFWSVPTLGEVS